MQRETENEKHPNLESLRCPGRFPFCAPEWIVCVVRDSVAVFVTFPAKNRDGVADYGNRTAILALDSVVRIKWMRIARPAHSEQGCGSTLTGRPTPEDTAMDRRQFLTAAGTAGGLVLLGGGFYARQAYARGRLSQELLDKAEPLLSSKSSKELDALPSPARTCAPTWTASASTSTASPPRSAHRSSWTRSGCGAGKNSTNWSCRRSAATPA